MDSFFKKKDLKLSAWAVTSPSSVVVILMRQEIRFHFPFAKVTFFSP